MRITTAWAKIQSQNIVLRLVILLLSLCTVGLATTTVMLSVRAPIVIERGDVTKVAEGANTEYTVAEIKEFSRTALKKRFDFDATDTVPFLSEEEQAFRNTEQKELAEREMAQRIVVYDMTVDGSSVTVDTDRVIRVKNARSALAFPLTLEISRVTRSRSNPYGLILSRVKSAKKEEEKPE